MDSANKTDKNLPFSVASSLLFQLGEQLVAKPSVALAELVKKELKINSYHVSQDTLEDFYVSIMSDEKGVK